MSTTIDQQFVEFIVKSLVSNPDKVSIERSIDEKGVLLELTVDPEDLGRVIGKRGAAAQALRTLLRALGTKNDARYNLKIVDVGGERPPRPERRDDRDDKPKNELTDEQTAEISKKDDVVTEDKVAENPAEEVKQEVVTEKEEEQDEDGRSSFERTRRELQDLDDLDI